MGTIRANSDVTGMAVNGITLGPPVLDGGVYYWDDPRVPDLDLTIPPPAVDDVALLALLGGTA